MEKRRSEQIPGNARYMCPSCRQPAIKSALVPWKAYVCPWTKVEVSVSALIAAAPKELRP